MKVNIKTLKGENFHLFMEPSYCFIDVKRQINKIRHIPIENQKIIYKGKAMQDSTILAQIGVKQDDYFVLMNLISNQIKQKLKTKAVETGKSQQTLNTQNKNKQKQPPNKQYQQKIKELVKIGCSRNAAQEILQKNGGDIKKSKDQFLNNKESKQQVRIEQVLKQQLNNIDQNEGMLQLDQNGNIHFPGNMQALSGFSSFLGSNKKLQKLLQQNPHILKQLLDGQNEPYLQGQDQQFQQQQEAQEEQQIVDIAFTQAQQQAIQRLVSLGFKRENVIPTYLACQKNEQQTANMLFNQLENGDFDQYN